MGKQLVVAAGAAAAIAVYLKARHDKEKAGEPTGNVLSELLDKIKIVGVLKYTIELLRDLWNPARLKTVGEKEYVRRLLAVVLPDFSGPKSERTEGRTQIYSLVAITFLRTWLMDRTANVTRTLAASALKRGTSRFATIWKECLFLITVGSGMSAYREYCTKSLAMVFRSRITKKVHESYFNDMSYYHIANLPGRRAIRDADERLASEVRSVSSRLTNVVTLLIKSITPIVWFTIKLWRWQGVGYAMIPHLYLLLAYEFAQRLFPKNIGNLWRAKAGAESGFRKAASRVQTHSEAITALGGHEREEEILSGKLKKLTAATKDVHVGNSKFDLIFKLFYTYGCRSWMTTFMMLPILNSAADSSVLTEEVAAMRYSWHMMIEMLVANGNLLTMHAQSQHMIGVSKRICTLLDGLDQIQTDRAEMQATTMLEGQKIKFEKAEIWTPMQRNTKQKKLLVRDLSFELNHGSSLLLTGHNGAGKSSIFRVLGGLWTTPTGTITKPGAGLAGTALSRDIFYLPQKPYNVLGSLRANITYPMDPADEGVELSKGELESLLALVDLSHLLAEYGDEGTDVLFKWEDILSLGEQQRLAMARLFFHKPKFAILDECTSAVSTSMEVLLYQECRQLGIAYITICHRPALRAWHDFNLNLLGDGKGGYEFKKIEKSADELAVSNQPQVPRGSPNDTKVNANQARVDARSKQYAALSKPKLAPKKRTATSKISRLLKIMLPGTYDKLGMLIGAIGLRTLMYEVHSHVVGTLYEAMVTRNVSQFVTYSSINVVVDLISAVVEASTVFAQNNLGTTWHAQLTEYASKRLFKGNSFYKLRNLDKRIGDPDQRLTVEMQDATNEFATIWGHAITPLVDVTWFTYRLYQLVSFRGMRDFYTYIALSVFVIKYFMPNHEALDSEEKKQESLFRFIHNRLRNHGESVAFFGGDETEYQIADRQFKKVVEHSDIAHVADSKFKFIFHTVNKDYSDPSNMLSAPDIVMTSLQATFVDSLDEGATDSMIANQSFYVQNAATKAVQSFGKLTDVYEHYTKLLASASRIVELFDVLDEMDKASATAVAKNVSDAAAAGVQESDDVIALNDVDIVTPTGVCLAQGIDLNISRGHSLMVTGHNATGKSSLFRVLSGLWPLQKGSLSAPRDQIQLVPQRVYSVSGTLADQITYPKHIDKRSEEDEAKLVAALDYVALKYLPEQYGGWDATVAWEDSLSLGEQQRIGVARVMYHKPSFVVLDECTDAVSANDEVKLYEAMHKVGVTCITISKRLALEDFHDQNLTLGQDTTVGWSLTATRKGEQ